MILQHHMEDTEPQNRNTISGPSSRGGNWDFPGVGKVEPCEASPVFLGGLVFTNQIQLGQVDQGKAHSRAHRPQATRPSAKTTRGKLGPDGGYFPAKRIMGGEGRHGV